MILLLIILFYFLLHVIGGLNLWPMPEKYKQMNEDARKKYFEEHEEALVILGLGIAVLFGIEIVTLISLLKIENIKIVTLAMLAYNLLTFIMGLYDNKRGKSFLPRIITRLANLCEATYYAIAFLVISGVIG